MAKPQKDQSVLRVSDLPRSRPTAFSIEPDSVGRTRIADTLNLSSVKKLTFQGTIDPTDGGGFALMADLGATVVQPCVVSLEPVSTRIDARVSRRYVADMPPSPGEDTEMVEDDSVEALGAEIDLGALLSEVLALEIPDYPRREDAGLDAKEFAPPGVAPMSDSDAKPFAGLAALKKNMKGDT